MYCLRTVIRKYSSNARKFQEVKIPVPWGHIAGKWWNPSDTRPVLTLHGWQDNSGSFDRLIPSLTQDVGFLAIDLPGHGHSSKIPDGMHYNFVSYLILIRQIKKFFKWPKISLMGHSLGGISSFSYSMLFPDTVDFLICLDALKPLHYKDNLQFLANGIKTFLKFDNQLRNTSEPPSYTFDEMKKMMGEVNFLSVDAEHCHHILERNIAPSPSNPGKFYFTRDARLKSLIHVNWPHEEILEGAKRVNFPIFIAKSTESPYYEEKERVYEVLDVIKATSPYCEHHYVEGNHHVHLNNPIVLVDLINNFITKVSNQDRSTGDVKNKAIFNS